MHRNRVTRTTSRSGIVGCPTATFALVRLSSSSTPGSFLRCSFALLEFARTLLEQAAVCHQASLGLSAARHLPCVRRSLVCVVLVAEGFEGRRVGRTVAPVDLVRALRSRTDALDATEEQVGLQHTQHGSMGERVRRPCECSSEICCAMLCD